MTTWNLSYNSVVLNLKIIQLNSLYQKREMTWSFQQVQKKCLKNSQHCFITNWLGMEGNLTNWLGMEGNFIYSTGQEWKGT